MVRKIIYLYFYDFLPLMENGGRRKEQAALQHELSQKLLAHALINETGTALQDYEVIKNEYGKPYLKNSPWFFNISHCLGAVCCAVSRQEIGVDIEPAERDALTAADRVCSENEKLDIERSSNKQLRFMQYWTLKESYVKYLGRVCH